MDNIKQNLVFAFVYNAPEVPLAAGALYPFFGLLLSPMIVAAAMSLSSASVISNALRLRRVESQLILNRFGLANNSPVEMVPDYQGPKISSSTTLAPRIPGDSSPTTTGPACFLTFVQGKFNGGGEEVWVRKRLMHDGSGIVWYYLLDIWKIQAGVGAGATCVY